MLRHSFGYALVAVLVLLVAQERNAQPNQANTSNEQQNANTQPVSTPIENPSPKIDNPADAASSGQRHKGDSKDNALQAEQLRQNEVIANATFWMAVFAGLNLLVAFIYAIFAFKTLQAIKEQSSHAGTQVEKMQAQLVVMREQTEAAKTSARAAEITAEATQRSVETAEKNFIVQMQPYIHVGARLKTFEMDRQMEIELIFFNEGNTVAEDVFVNYSMSISERPEPNIKEKVFKTASFKALPHKAMPVSVFSRIMWDKPFNAIRYGSAWFFCWGNGSYSGLGGTYPIEFCFVYRRETGAFGNCADLTLQGKAQKAN